LQNKKIILSKNITKAPLLTKEGVAAALAGGVVLALSAQREQPTKIFSFPGAESLFHEMLCRNSVKVSIILRGFSPIRLKPGKFNGPHTRAPRKIAGCFVFLRADSWSLLSRLRRLLCGRGYALPVGSKSNSGGYASVPLAFRGQISAAEITRSRPLPVLTCTFRVHLLFLFRVFRVFRGQISAAEITRSLPLPVLTCSFRVHLLFLFRVFRVFRGQISCVC
jgi:hypothetical protein